MHSGKEHWESIKSEIPDLIAVLENRNVKLLGFDIAQKDVI